MIMELLSVSPTAKAPANNFTGDVYVNPIYRGKEPSRMIVSLVRFTPGARTNWHSHAMGQTLHGTDGVGLVATRDGTVIRMRAGARRGHAVPGHRTLIEPESFAAGLGHDEASPGGFVERLDGSKKLHGWFLPCRGGQNRPSSRLRGV